MASLFSSSLSFPKQSWWGRYTLFFCLVVGIERYFVIVKTTPSCVIYPEPFFSQNHWRLLALILPVLLLAATEKRWGTEPVLRDLPILLLGLCVLATSAYQAVYLLLYALSCWFLPHLRWSLLSLFAVIFAGFLLYPNFIGISDCSWKSSVKANMHTFQTLVEIYATEHKGLYPPTATHLRAVATDKSFPSNPYWKNFYNPMTHQLGYGHSYSDISVEGLERLEQHSPFSKQTPKDIRRFAKSLCRELVGIRLCLPAQQTVYLGQVLYFRPHPHHYLIYGVDEANHLMRDRNSTFILSNGK